MFRCLSIKVSIELLGFAKRFCAIFLANQMLVGLVMVRPSIAVRLSTRVLILQCRLHSVGGCGLCTNIRHA